MDVSAQAEIRKKKILSKEIGGFDVGRPDFGGRWPRGEALGKKRGIREVRLAEALEADRPSRVTTAGGFAGGAPPRPLAWKREGPVQSAMGGGAECFGVRSTASAGCAGAESLRRWGIE